MYGCFLCQEASGDPVVLGIPAIALLGGATGPAIDSPSYPHCRILSIGELNYLRIFTPTSCDVRLARQQWVPVASEGLS